MKKKINKNTKIQNPPRRTGSKSATADRSKNPTFKVVKDSQVVYRSDKESIKSPSYTNAPLGKIEIVRDFLPSPEKLVLKDSTIKVTLNLSKSSVDFFKNLAEKHGSQYQKVIRILLDSYTSNFSK